MRDEGPGHITKDGIVQIGKNRILGIRRGSFQQCEFQRLLPVGSLINWYLVIQAGELETAKRYVTCNFPDCAISNRNRYVLIMLAQQAM